MMLVEMVNLHNGERHKYDIADENGYDKYNADGNDKYYADGNDKYYADGNAYDCIFQPGCSTSNPRLQGAWGETRTTQVYLKRLKCYWQPNSCYQQASKMLSASKLILSAII